MTIQALQPPRATILTPRFPLAAVLRQSAIQIGILLLLLAPPISLGARIELLLFPIRTHQSIPSDSILRTADRLCWTWVSDKTRVAVADNVDVLLDTADGDRSYPEVFDAITNLPWHRRGSLAAGHYEHAFCVQLPAYIKPGDPIRLRQTIHYRGFLNLWAVMVRLPDVLSPPQSS